MIYIEMHHHEPEYISAHVEAIGQEPAGTLFSARIENDGTLTADDYCRGAQAILAKLPDLLRAAYDAGEQSAREGQEPGAGFHLEQIDDRGEGINI